MESAQKGQTVLTKDKRRGERRWRSYCVWMRRLRADWATHGRQYSIRPVYDWDGSDPKKVIGWVNDLCKCFDLKHREAIRFKDTPTGRRSHAADRKRDGWHDQREWEERNVLPDDGRERRPRRRRRDGTHPYRVCCRSCGFLLKIVEVKNGSFYHGSWLERCEACSKRENRCATNMVDIKAPV